MAVAEAVLVELEPAASSKEGEAVNDDAVAVAAAAVAAATAWVGELVPVDSMGLLPSPTPTVAVLGGAVMRIPSFAIVASIDADASRNRGDERLRVKDGDKRESEVRFANASLRLDIKKTTRPSQVNGWMKRESSIEGEASDWVRNASSINATM